MKKEVKQRDITDCGAACLSSIAANYKLELSVAKIRQFAGTDRKGTTITGIIEAAGKMGMEAKGVRAPFESIGKIPLPAIAHVIINEKLHHYVVIYKVTSKYLDIMDPAFGRINKIKHNKFKAEWTGVLVILMPGKEFKQGINDISKGQRLLSLVKPHRFVLLQIIFGAIGYTLLGLSTSVFVQKIVDFVIIDGNKNLLNLMSIGMIILLFVQLSIGIVKTVFTIKIGQYIDAHLILGYYKHLLKLPQSFFDSMRVGEIISRINDAVKIRAFLNDAGVNFLVNIFIILFSFAMMFTYYWKLAVIMLSAIPLYLLIFAINNKVNKKVQRVLMEDAADLESQLIESLNSVGTIKRFGLEEFNNEKTETRFVKMLQTVYLSSLNSVSSNFSSEFISKLLTIILLWVGAGYVLNNQITPGELLSFYTLIGYFTSPVASLIGMNKTFQDALIASDRLFEIMDLDKEDNENRIELLRSNVGDINFRNVSFRYGARPPLFNNLNLKIEKGKFTAIIGESGSGKSSLMSILQNIYPISEGTISIGEIDLKYITPKSLRTLITVVPQQIDLFKGNIIENIAVGDYEPDLHKILTISTQLGIINFIESLPNGFRTDIGENGTALSGGQRQRIAIARALYKDPEILILDEATSSLDSTSEIFVQKTVNLLKKNKKTIIVIAHRLSTLYQADKIIVLENGIVAESGCHDDLMLTKDSLYANFWKQQIPN